MFIANPVKPWAYAVAAAVLFAAGGAAGWGLNGWRLDARAANTARDVAKEAQKRSDAYVAQLKAVQAARDGLRADLAKVDEQRTKERDDAKKELDRLRDCVRSGKCGLRVNATCTPAPGSPRDVSPTGPDSGVDTATAPRLTADAERDYFALREALKAQYTQLGACVDTLGRITGQRPVDAPGGGLRLKLSSLPAL